MNTKRSLVLIFLVLMMVQGACTASADACPASTIDTELLTDTEDGYCLLYPTKYSTEVPDYIVINPVSAPGDQLGDAWVSIETEAAAGRTAAQVADAQISSAGSGFNITRTEASVDGEPAVVVDGLPGPDSWRKVFIVHNQRLYTLTFLPWQPAVEGAGQQPPLEGLYTMIMQSLHFLPTES
jgi:hypothetical protein